MAFTKDFKKTVAKHVAKDREFRHALLLDAMNEFLTGDLCVAKLLLRDYINACPQFDAIAREMNKNSKSIQRILGSNGDPTAENLTALLKAAQKLEGVKVELRLQ